MEARGESVGGRGSGLLDSIPGWALAAAAAAAIVAVLGALAIVGGDSLPDRRGPPVEELAVESVELAPNQIELTLRNTGPDPVEVAQAFVNDAYVDFNGADASRSAGSAPRPSTLDYPWQEGQPYLVSLVTSTGVVIEHEIAAAVETPSADGDLFALMALLGLYVGVIPVALGMLLLPAMRRSRPGWIRILMAVTIGLLGVPRRRRHPRGRSRSAASRAARSAASSCSSRRRARLSAAHRRSIATCAAARAGAAAPGAGRRASWR